MKCNFCNKNIENKKEYFYIGCWRPCSKSTNVLRYHSTCFEEIAGKEYINQINENINSIPVQLELPIENTNSTFPFSQKNTNILYSNKS